MASDRLFIKVHNGFPEHPKTGDLSDRAFRNLIELWCYCSRNLTDGVVKNAQANKILSPKSRRELVEAGFMVEGTGAVIMHNYLEHQQSAQQVADLRERRAEAGSKGGKAKASRLASATATRKQTPGKPVADTDTDKEPDVSADAETRRGTGVVDIPRDDVTRLCDHLATRIEANTGRIPNTGKTWRDAARLMLDRDGRPEDEIHGAIDWCQNDEFWRANILSMPKLREKYDQLKMQAQRKQGPTRKNDIDWDAAFARAAARDAQQGEIA